MNIKKKFLILLSLIVVSLEFVSSSNNFYLKNPCEFNDDNTLLTCEMNIKDKDKISSQFFNGKEISQNKIIEQLKFELRKLEGDALHIKIKDSNNQRYEIPRNAIEYFELDKGSEKLLNNKSIQDLLDLKENDQFRFELKDEDGEGLLNLFNENLVYLDDFINFDYKINSNEIFGYGERIGDFRLKPGVYTTWPRDVGNTFDDGKGARNSYGHQSFAMIRNKKDSYIGLSFLNSNAGDLYISESETNKNFMDSVKTNINQISIGGIIELLITTGKTPLEVLRKYHNIIGKPVLPNLWSLGFNQCRWGYKNVHDMKVVIDRYREEKIPLDTIWSDINYMKDYEDFGYDEVNFKGLPEFIDEVHKRKMHYVPIIDMGIPFRKENYYYKLGKELDVFIKSNYTKTDLLNDVWPGTCVYPDFTNYKDTKKFWQKGLSNLHDMIKFDGIWLDMNEPSGFFDGEKDNPNDPLFNKYSDLTYSPGLNVENYNIDTKSLSVNAILSKENEPFNTIYNLKPLNVFYQNKMTNDYFIKNEKRPFVLSRSSFTGMGRYTSHWLGDNTSTFNDMKYSISGIFNFQMFGFNQVGADICGFNGSTNDNLCARWITLGSFYPFSRNHNTWTSIPQEPWALGERTLNSSKKAIRYRYSLIRYIYSQMYLSSLNGGAFFQPLFFQFPEFDELVNDDNILNNQIMLGDSILFNPILQENEDNIKSAMPNEKWNKFPNGEIVMNKNPDINKISYMEFPGTYNDIHLFIKGGSIIPYYDILNDENVLTTKDLENYHISFIVNPDSFGKAKGNIIYDIPNSNPYRTLNEKLYLHYEINFDLNANKIDLVKLNDFDYTGRDLILDKIILYNTNIKNMKKSKDNFYDNEINRIVKNHLRINAVENNNEYYESNGNLIIKFNNPISLKNRKSIKW